VVEGCVSDSSDDEKESETEDDVPETSRGVRRVEERSVVRPGGVPCVDPSLCDVVVCSWDATLRGRGSLFLWQGISAFNPEISGVPVVRRGCEGGLC